MEKIVIEIKIEGAGPDREITERDPDPVAGIKDRDQEVEIDAVKKEAVQGKKKMSHILFFFHLNHIFQYSCIDQ